MAISNKIYSMKEFQAAVQYESTPLTANVTDMRLFPLSGDVSVTENVFRRQDVQAGLGRTPKAADIKVVSKGNIKTISIPFFLDEVMFMNLMENGAGVAREVDGSLNIAFNHTPAGVDFESTTYADFTGTVTLAMIHPKANESEIWPGCVLSTMNISATKGTDSGLFTATAEFVTQSEPLTDQATPTGLVDYVVSDLNIGDFCATSQVNGVDIALNAFTTAYTFNPKMIGQCTEGAPVGIQRSVAGIFVDHTLVYALDDNTVDDFKKGRSASTFSIELTNGSDLKFLSASCNPTGGITKSNVEDMAFWSLSARAFAGSSGNLHEVNVSS